MENIVSEELKCGAKMGVDVSPYMQQGGGKRGGGDTRSTLTALPTPNPQHQRLDHAALQWNNPLTDYHALDTIKIHIASYLFSFDFVY